MEQHVFKQQQKSTSKFVLLINYLHSKKVFTTSNPLRSAHVGFFWRGWGWGGGFDLTCSLLETKIDAFEQTPLISFTPHNMNSSFIKLLEKNIANQ